MSFQNMKFRVESPEHSVEIQKTLFEMGYKWSYYRDTTVREKADKFLYSTDYGQIQHGSQESTFNSHSAEEHELVLKPTIQKVDKKAKRKLELLAQIENLQTQAETLQKELESLED